ncbi:hypothetical protein HHL24_27090 [Paraburkholderia sp. RP-4-7]|uniref:Uncharacterized protein n=1 Tax=Paraburkholderia polaris TaxID=2728848 RepID=A0A848IIR3_9BURK|nr:hypothetical protein [Paraburkholderia polaris]NMM01591.1 hypothetical protein [Paraburkholderia polaris]
MKSIANFVSSAMFLALGLVFGHLAATQGHLAYAAGAGICGLLGLGFIVAGLRRALTA